MKITLAALLSSSQATESSLEAPECASNESKRESTNHRDKIASHVARVKENVLFLQT